MSDEKEIKSEVERNIDIHETSGNINVEVFEKPTEAEEKNKDDENFLILSKKLLRHTIVTGKMENSLKTAANSLDVLKTFFDSMAYVSSKVREKLLETNENYEVKNTFLQGKNLFAPMFLNLLNTEEFRQIIANTLVQVLK